MTKYDIDSQVEDYYGTFAGEPANEDVYSLSSFNAAEYEEYIFNESKDESH